MPWWQGPTHHGINTLQQTNVYVEQLDIKCNWGEYICMAFLSWVIIWCLDSSVLKFCLIRKNLGCQQVLCPVLCILMLVCVDSCASLKYAGSWISDEFEWTPIIFQVKQYWLQSRKDRWLLVFTTESYCITHHVLMVLDHLWIANSLGTDIADLSIRILS